jgi:hypothetical protein
MEERVAEGIGKRSCSPARGGVLGEACVSSPPPLDYEAVNQRELND